MAADGSQQPEQVASWRAGFCSLEAAGRECLVQSSKSTNICLAHPGTKLEAMGFLEVRGAVRFPPTSVDEALEKI
jgi:hypothetical protein